MKKIITVFACLSLLMPLSADELFQYSTIDALVSGIYDGDLTVREMLEEGDFGIGTFNGLEGEMLVLEGEVYRLLANGRVSKPTLDVEIPYCNVCQFDAEDAEVYEVTPGDYPSFKASLDSMLPSLNYPYAILIEGRFAKVTARSVHKQSKPYPPISQVIATQAVFDYETVEGIMVGFRSPEYLQGIAVPGYHFHFIKSDKSSGGHVLDFVSSNVKVQVMKLEELDLVFPDTHAFAKANLNKDRSTDVHRVENARK